MLEREAKHLQRPPADEERLLLLFFCSQRSGPARRMESLIATVGYQERDRVRVATVDVDEHPELAARCEVTSVPTLVLIRHGRVLGRLIGRSSRPQIDALIDQQFDPQTATAPDPPESAA